MSEFLNSLIRFDTDLFLFLNSFHNNFFDTVMKYVSGKYTWLPLYFFILFMIFKKFTVKTGFIILFVSILLITLSDQTSVFMFKFTFLRLRPCYNPEISNIVHNLSLPGGKYGFISSHASNTFALAVFTLLVLKNIKYSVFILIWAGLVSYSRIYLGVHYPADIFFGALWGVFLAFLIYFLMKNLILKHNIPD